MRSPGENAEPAFGQEQDIEKAIKASLASSEKCPHLRVDPDDVDPPGSQPRRRLKLLNAAWSGPRKAVMARDPGPVAAAVLLETGCAR